MSPGIYVHMVCDRDRWVTNPTTRNILIIGYGMLQFAMSVKEKTKEKQMSKHRGDRFIAKKGDFVPVKLPSKKAR
jgi:hypothetical protein